jgi:hypothetical protein
MDLPYIKNLALGGVAYNGVRGPASWTNIEPATSKLSKNYGCVMKSVNIADLKSVASRLVGSSPTTATIRIDTKHA